MKKYYGSYTPEATKSLKGCERLICRTAEDGTIYLCNGYLIFSMTSAEYDTVARPATQCDAGNWAMDKDGKRSETNYDLEKHFTEAVKAAETAAQLRRSALLVDVGKNQLAACYYNADKDFSAFFNRHFTASLASDTVLKSAGTVSAAVAFTGDRPFAMILPIRPESKNARAVKAYFTESDKATEDAGTKDQKIDHLTERNTDLRAEVRSLKEQNAQQAAEIEAQQNKAAAQAAEIAALREQIAQQAAQLEQAAQQAAEDAAEESKPEPKTAAELIAARWSEVDGLTASVKGAQTASPVVWLDGDTQPHAKEIEAEGGKWSNKRNAYYFRVA
jgi:hypothetical protein